MFSYGIMLLEVFTGKKPTDTMFTGGLSLREWVNGASPSRFVDVVDPNIFLDDETTSSGDLQDARWPSGEESSNNGTSCLAQILDIGLQCTRDLPEERMTMKDVAAELARVKKGLSSR